MKRSMVTEKLMLEEVALIAKEAQKVSRGLSMGEFIKMIRQQLGMTQSILAKRARIPQATLSNMERGKTTSNSVLNKVLNALFCDFLVLPILREPIDVIKKKQARTIAEKHIQYLKGTMNLEKQQPNAKLMNELLKVEEEALLKGPGKKLWEE